MAEVRSSMMFLFALLLVTLNGCGGNTQIAEGGVGGTGVTMGRVTGFGSILVNGIRFEVENADFIYEEEVAPQVGDDSGIKVGMVVRITGSDDGSTGEAHSVEYANLLRGTLTSASIASNDTGTLVAMGQSITVDADTVYDDGGWNIPTSLLPLDAVIEVSGFTDGSGEILATRIELISPTYGGETVEVKGFVSDFGTSPGVFQLGTLIVDHTGIGLPRGIGNDLYVEVTGRLSGGILLASDVEIEGDGDLTVADDGEAVELEGIVTEIISSTPSGTLFILNGQQVMVDEGTAFTPSGDAGSITLGRSLEAEGQIQANTLVASRIEFKASAGDKQELEAMVTQVDPAAGSFTLLGQTIQVTSSTIYEDDRDGDQFFNLSRLVAELDYVEVDLFIDPDGNLVASKLERESNESPFQDHAEIEGLVQAVDAQQITLVNVKVDISGLTGFNPVVDERVEIEGLFDAATGILTATSGESESAGD